MINRSSLRRTLTAGLMSAGFILLGGSLVESHGQSRDPFAKPAWARKNEARPGVPGSGKVAGPPVNLGAPGIEQRIEFYKRLRETAAANGEQIPKVTSVLTLDEMAVTGIFRTPRGYAAMVEATPIKLSYTIYPGEKFFDGQLVAVEENRLVFRKVTKVSNGKFLTSVENKPLRKYTSKEVVQGTVPAGSPTEESERAAAAPKASDLVPATGAPVVPTVVVSPLEEMNKQAAPTTTVEKSKEKDKKPVKVARRRK